MYNWYEGIRWLEREDAPLDCRERIRAAGGPLLAWYEKNRRPLPWRESRDPYRVWISEIMLQQTRVEAVKPYFARFMERVPDIRALAGIDEEALLKLWEGLGYYSRARNLKKAAAVLCGEYGGAMPASYEAIRALPGIGPYTAGAVASIAFGIPEPAVDGNVLRVLARLFADGEPVDKPPARKRYEELLREDLRRRAKEAADKKEQAFFWPGDYNQAWIELGAIVCLPAGRPLCGECPLEGICAARRAGNPERYPLRTPKKPRRTEDRCVFLIEWEDRAAIRRRAARGLLASLYEFPNIEGHPGPEEAVRELGLADGDVEEIAELPAATHVFSHVEWRMIGYRVRLRRPLPELFELVKKEEIFEKYPLPGAFAAYTNVLK